MTRTVRRSRNTQRKPESASAPTKATSPSAAADPAQDFLAPDAPVSHVVRHAKAMAALLRLHAPKLTLVKLSVADADRLDALAAALDEAEHAS